jgi:hypothetical protein
MSAVDRRKNFPQKISISAENDHVARKRVLEERMFVARYYVIYAIPDRFTLRPDKSPTLVT